MSLQEMHEIIRIATEAGHRVMIIQIEGLSEPLVRACPPTARMNGAAQNLPSAQRPEGADSLAERLLAVTAGVDTPLKLRQWSRLIASRWVQPVSERELERAVAAKAMPGRAKETGRDHKGIVVEPDDLRKYLSLCWGVQRSEIPPPDWWNNVRKGRNGHIS